MLNRLLELFPIWTRLLDISIRVDIQDYPSFQYRTSTSFVSLPKNPSDTGTLTAWYTSLPAIRSLSMDNTDFNGNTRFHFPIIRIPLKPHSKIASAVQR